MLCYSHLYACFYYQGGNDLDVVKCAHYLKLIFVKIRHRLISQSLEWKLSDGDCLAHSVKPVQILEQLKNTFMSKNNTRISNSYSLWLSPRDASKSFASAPFSEATQQSSEADTVCVNLSSQTWKVGLREI